jgi:hypothetical protein
VFVRPVEQSSYLLLARSSSSKNGHGFLSPYGAALDAGGCSTGRGKNWVKLQVSQEITVFVC